MFYFSATITVNAPSEIVWELLVDKSEHPDRYVAGVEGLEILERYPDGFLRTFTKPMHIKEKISINEQKREVIFTLVDPQVFSGYFFNRIHTPEDTSTSHINLEYGFAVEPVDPNVPLDEFKLPAMFFDTLMHTKQMAEEKSKAA